MLHKAYAIAATVATPFVAAGLLAFRRGRIRYSERLGRWGEIPGTPWWFHGASVGEVQGLSPVLRLFRERFSSEQILLTGTSPTGLERGAALADWTRLVPIDSPLLVRRALRSVRPKQFVVAETELWPELMREALARKIPLSIVNARISDYTQAWYARLGSLFRPIISECRLICVPDEQQRDRYIALGATPDRVHVTGHTKYDVEPKFPGSEKGAECKEALFCGLSEHSRILVLGSVRPEEETWWFAACEEAWRKGLDLRLVVVPRHQERFSYFASALSARGIPFERRSEMSPGEATSEKVLLVDQMGKLEACYAAADLAFVGATLVDVGGHNPLEPAMYGVPVVVGPHISVIRNIVGELTQAQGVFQVSSAVHIHDLIQRLFAGSSGLAEVGAHGQRVWERHRGAAERVLRLLVGE